MNNPSPSLPHTLAIFLLTLVSFWLIIAGMNINIDYGDGYATVVNAQYLLGVSSDWNFQRGPIIALLLVPAEFFANKLSLNPIDIRPHHLTMSLIHMLYLWGIYYWLKQKFQASYLLLLIFSGVILNYIFFSYAPMISHDIFPGAILVLMMENTRQYLLHNKFSTLLQLSLLGACAFLIKHTYAIFWISILISLIILSAHKKQTRIASLRQLTNLFYAAMASALFGWSIYASLLQQDFPQTPFLFRPMEQFSLIRHMYDDEGGLSNTFPWWIYFRNAQAFGSITCLFVAFGVILSIRSKLWFNQFVAVVWVTCFSFMLAVGFKEVRYLEYLAPLSAFLIVAPLQYVYSYRKTLSLFVLISILCIDLTKIIPELSRISSVFYKSSVEKFLSPISNNSQKGDTILLFDGKALSFAPALPSPIFADRFHEIFHINDFFFPSLYANTNVTPILIHTKDVIYEHEDLPENSIIIYTGDSVLARIPPFRQDNVAGIDGNPVQFIGQIKRLHLVKEDDIFKILDHDGSIIMLINKLGLDKGAPLSSYGFSKQDLSETSYKHLNENSVELMAIQLHAICDNKICNYLNEAL